MARYICAALVALGTITTAHAEGAFGLKASTLGLGVEGVYHVSERWSLRGGINAFGYEFDDEVDGVAYDGDLDLANLSVVADFRPFRGGLRLSAGAVYNDNEIAAVADPDATYTIGNMTYTQAEVGVLAADVAIDGVAPYVGIGYDIALGDDWRLTFDLGAVFQGAPEPVLTSTGGLLSDNPQFQDDLAVEQQNFEDDLDEFDVYPVVAIGLALAF
ncbi:MAG: hypothetical protein AAFZ58_05560 [Pseudomonadota bacterium]